MGMNRNQVSRYRDERWDCTNFTKTDHGEGRKFVKVSFKSVMIRTDTWMKNGENERLKKADGRRIFERRRKKRKKRKTSKKMKKVLKKGLLFFKKWNIMWQMSAKGMK